MSRGTLRVYLGAAPGVGKTFAMLNEGWRRLERGQHVVVGLVETHNRALTEAQVRDLEVVPRKKVTYRGKQFTELEVEAIIAKKPEIILIDEMAHTNIPGMKHEKRWEDIEELRNAGINVLTTLNIQHLESINDVVARITGVTQKETIPDRIVRSADQLELVDISPEALRRRMAHGNIYPSERVDTALANYFKVENLSSLRELALLWVANQVDDALQELRERSGISQAWELREKVVVAVDGSLRSEPVIRRAARLAQRFHADFLAVHVRTDDGLRNGEVELDSSKQLVSDLGGEFHQLAASDVAEALINFANSQNATQLVIGAHRSGKFDKWIRGSVVSRAIDLAKNVDVHVIGDTAEIEDLDRSSKKRTSPIRRRRRIFSWMLAAAGLPSLTLCLTNLRDVIALPGVLLIYLLLVVFIGATGGLRPGVTSAVIGFLLANWFFTPPFHHLSVSQRENVIALVVYLTVAIVVSGLVDRAARQSIVAVKANSEAEELARVAATMVHEDPLLPLMAQLRTSFEAKNVAVFRRENDQWIVEANDGDSPRTDPDGATMTESLSPDTVVAIDGENFEGEDLRVLHAFFDQLRSALEGRKLRVQARAAADLKATNELRTALLQAVSHDFRTPLAAIKASVSSLRQGDVAWSEVATNEFLATIEEETDRLNRLVGNLLDMSRIQAEAVHPESRAVELDDVVSAALNSLGHKADDVVVKLPFPPALVNADAALLERALANIIENAVKWSPQNKHPRVEAAALLEEVVIRVVDQGPGIPETERERVFAPFQRVDDRANDGGVGLGLAVARGFLRSFGSDLSIDDTPGGGVTMNIELESAK